MTTTLVEIHRDPEIIDRAIAACERLDIVLEGSVLATLAPAPHLSTKQAREVMAKRFGSPDWNFALTAKLSREERNSRD